MKVCQILFVFLVFFVLFSSIKSQRKNRWRKKKDPKRDCHLKSLEKCYTKIDEKNLQSNRHLILKTEEGYDEICRDAQDLIQCVKKHIEICGTPLQYEFADFLIEHLVKSTDLTCKPGKIRSEFTAHSECLVAKVFDSKDYKVKCSRQFQATLSGFSTNMTVDERHGSFCCAYSRLKYCSGDITLKECKKEALDAVTNWRDQGLGNLLHVMCPSHSYDWKKKSCKRKLEPFSKLTTIDKDHPLIKYLLAYMRFVLPK